jgi:hypothetical protein
MKNWFTKKNLAIFALTLSLIGWGANKLGYIKYSPAHAIIDPALAVLAILLLLYFLREEIFRSWLKFVAWWIPVGSLLVFTGLGSSGIPGNLFPAQFFAFTIISMSGCLFALKSWELHRIDKGNPPARWVKWPSFLVAFVLSVVLSFYLYGLIW